jgi:hypothetical protein
VPSPDAYKTCCPPPPPPLLLQLSNWSNSVLCLAGEMDCRRHPSSNNSTDSTDSISLCGVRARLPQQVDQAEELPG